ncbi:acyl-CoA dehydrogenase family protein [Nitrosomonas sp. Is37]|uniref:acyl-CoA dehydrogenase family protein n=1 Tax=Nitrosomonas sp. Is37 TaxID=3080535 RepID=UPI00294AE063|nr:acyl-CoA dehydrogenase family protein [Nitrosomonas sp. Is37]MDV6343412.1 acyl-CoA dehydrogenase family protein [Nitrosomonas sp. Is37]
MFKTHQESNHTTLAKSLAEKVREFVDEQIVPNESLLSKDKNIAFLLHSGLISKARSAGLWGLFHPLPYGGKIASLEDYLLVAEQEGRTEFSPTIFGSDTTLDAHMLFKFGSDEIRENFLEPLVSGTAIPSYGMTEPGRSGSIPALITTSAQLSNGNWVINGRKWFISNIDRATFTTVLARTADNGESLNKSLSMIIVPTDTPGFKIERQIRIMGSDLSQGEISFVNVKVPEQNLLGMCGSGTFLMSQRLGLGRLLRSMSWLALAQRCMDLMGARINSERGKIARLPEKQLIRQHFVNVYEAIASARELIRLAAKSIDAQFPNDIEINVAKLAASRALCIASDSAIQLYGAEGISELTPLSGISRIARASRILDGTAEALVSSTGRRLINFYKENQAYQFI